MIDAAKAIDVVRERFGDHPGYRALHAKGTVCEGTFTATPEAAGLTRAPHMQGAPVRCVVRLSNGGGDPTEPDYAPDVRGLAVGFELPDGSRTDILSQTAPRFPFRDIETFLALVRLSKREVSSLPRMLAFLAGNPRVARALPPNMKALGPPASYFAVPYYPIHAVKWLGADGGERWVRYSWLPTDALPGLGMGEAKKRGRDYLRDELVARLEQGSGEFELQVQIAAASDDPHDPSSRWPEDRERIVVGTLQVDAVSSADHSELIFDPMRLCDGIEPSDDPILQFRPAAYAHSYEYRTG